MSVRLATLPEVCDLVTDGTHYTPPAVATGIPFLTVKDMTSDGLDFSNAMKISREEYAKALSGNSAPKVGDVLFSKDGTVGKVHVVTEKQEFAVLSSIAILRPDQTKIDSGYLGHVLLAPSILNEALKRKTGSAIRRIILSDLKEIKFPLPELTEQKRIASILDKANNLRCKRQQTIRLADHFLRAVFLDMFGDPVTNPKGWPVVSFGDVVKNCDGQRVPVSSADRALRQGAYPYYGASGVIDTIDDFLFEGPSLLIGEDGANLLTRSTPIAFIATGKYWVNNHAHVLQENGMACLEFLEFAINKMRLDDYITGSAQPKLNQANLNRIPIILPPIELQKKFVASRSAIGKLQEKHNRSLSVVGDMASALQNEAFA